MIVKQLQDAMNINPIRKSAAVVLLGAVAVFCADRLSAQNFEVRLSYSGYPSVAAYHYSDDCFFGCWHDDDYFISDGTLGNIYKDYRTNVYCTGNLSVEFAVIFKKWLTLSAVLSYNHFWADEYEGVSNTFKGHSYSNIFYALPEVQFTYVHKPCFKLYSGVGLGVGFYDNFEHLDSPVNMEAQMIPIGVMVGRKLFGFAEIGYGTVYCGAKVGIGYRF